MIKDVACGLAGVALAVGYYVLADDLPRSLLSDPTGADGLPKALAVLLAVLSLAMIVVSIVRRNAGRDVDSSAPGVARHLRAAGMVGLGVLCLVALPWLGYLATIFVFILAVAVYAGTRLGLTPVAVSAAGAVLLWATFVHLFGIAMPRVGLF